MSLVGKQRGDTRRNFSLSFGAVVSALALVMPAALPNAAPEAGGARPSMASPRALPPGQQRKKAAAKAEKRSPGWRQDGRKARRRALMALFGLKNSGRQYEFVRRALRVEAPELLRMSVAEIQGLTFVRSGSLEANRRAA